MKVRLEIIDEDGIESANVEFAGRHWKKRLLAFLDTVEDNCENRSEPSFTSSNSNAVANGQNCQSRYVTQDQGVIPHAQQPVQDVHNPQHVQQPAQNVHNPQHVQQPVQQMGHSCPHQQQFQHPQQQYTLPPAQQPAQQYNPQQPYSQQPVNHYYQPQYLPPAFPPSGAQQYGSGQMAQPISYAPPPSETSAQRVVPSVSNMYGPANQPQSNQPQRRKTAVFQERMNDMSLTISERLELFLKYEYPRVWFSSQDVQQHYERVYGDIKQSTVSTYLSRMYRKNLLERRGNRTQREYRYIGDETEASCTAEGMPEAPVFHRLHY